MYQSVRKKTILVTGANGFIGANLVRKLLEQRFPVHILVRHNSDDWRIRDVKSRLHISSVNYNDIKLIRKILMKIRPQVIFHLAAYGGYPFQHELEKIVDANIVSTVNLLTAADSVGYELFVNTGSSSEYGFKNKPMRETDCLKPASFYAATKAAVTYLTQIYSDRFGKNIVTVRPFSIYGPYEEQSRLIPTVIVSCLRGRILEITQGNEKRDFLYVKDIVEGYLKLMSDTVKLKGTIINFGSGRQHSTRDVVKLIHSLTKSKSKILWGKYPARNWDTNFWVADNNLAKKLIDWEPNYNLSDGITETIKWFKRHLYFYENKR